MQDTAAPPRTVTFTINGAKEIVTGSGASDLALDGTDYADIVNGLVGDDRIDGLGGNDIITGGQGVDTIAGGTGTDTAVYSGAWKDYAISQAVGGTITLIDQRTGTPDGTDHVNTVELFEFSNGTYTAAQILKTRPSSRMPLQLKLRQRNRRLVSWCRRRRSATLMRRSATR